MNGLKRIVLLLHGVHSARTKCAFLHREGLFTSCKEKVVSPKHEEDKE